jgi:t-SNARE complex subunit (syntaxin)
MSTVADRLSQSLAKLEAQLPMLNLTLNNLNEIINGTAKTGGLKERIAIAEQDIKKNKESFDKIDENITNLRNEMLIEVGKLANSIKESRPKGINWNSVMQAVVTAIAVGVTGIAFWQMIIWLAAHSPVK